MLKIDSSIVKEFLGDTTNITEMITPLKCCRLYSKRGDGSKFILILTPMLSEDYPMIKTIIDKKYGNMGNILVHQEQRGKNKVYVFEKAK